MRIVRVGVVAVIVAVVAVAGYWVYKQLSIPPEERVRYTIDGIRQGIESGSVGSVMERIAGDYWDGRYTKMDIRRMALQALQSSPHYDVVIESIQVDPVRRGSRQATAHIRADVSQKGTFANTAAWAFTVDGTFKWTLWHGWQATSFTGWQLAVEKEIGED